MEIKQSTTFRVPVRLLDGNGVPITGTASNAVVVYLQKQGGSSTVKSVTGSDWFEIDALNFPGVYDLLLSTTDTDTTGFLKYSVKTPSSETYIGLMEVVANIEVDTFTAVTAIKKYNEGRWKIDTVANTMTIYDTNGTTPLYVFDLKDDGGLATSTNIFERVPQ